MHFTSEASKYASIRFKHPSYGCRMPNLLTALVSQRLSPKSVDDDQWSEIVELALHHSLAPMLYWVIKGAGINPESDPRWSSLKSATQQSATKFILLDRARFLFNTALKDASIRTIWLKGIALAHTVYPQPWLRPMGDLDVLVPYKQRKLALATGESLGFQLPDETGILNVDIPEDLQHHYVLFGSVVNSVCLELHYRLLGTDGLELLPGEQLDWFWGNSSIRIIDGDEFTILNPEAQLLYLCAHALIQHGEANTPLFRYFDLHLLVTKTALDWQIVVDKALELKWSYAVGRALKLAVKYFDTPVPDWVSDQLRTLRSIEENTFRVVRLQGKGNRWESEMMFLSKLSFADRLRVIFILLFPPKNFIQERYSISPGHPILPYYFYRWFDVGREVVWSARNRFVRIFRN